MSKLASTFISCICALFLMACPCCAELLKKNTHSCCPEKSEKKIECDCAKVVVEQKKASFRAANIPQVDLGSPVPNYFVDVVVDSPTSFNADFIPAIFDACYFQTARSPPR